MALLVGLHHQEPKRIDRARIARAVKRSVKTVQRALAELQSYGWVEFAKGGNGTPGTIRVINDKAWIMASVSRNVQISRQDVQLLAETVQISPRIRSLEVLQGKERVSPSRSVENPPYAESAWLELERFAAAHNLPLSSGADIDAALRMYERKPPASEGLSLAAKAVSRS